MQIATQINPKALEAISLFVCTPQERAIKHALTGVLVEVMPTETRVVAMDGNNLGIYRMPQDNHIDHCHRVIISADAVKQVKAMIGRSRPKNYGHSIAMTFDDDPSRPCPITFGCWSLGVITTRPVEGSYPDYSPIMPKVISGERGGLFPPERLITFDRAAKILSKQSCYNTFFDTCRLYHNGPAAPGVVTIISDPNFTGFVMATNADNDGVSLDTWWLAKESEVAND